MTDAQNRPVRIVKAARRVRADDEILVDPLDPRSGAVVYDVKRLYPSPDVTIYAIRDGKFYEFDMHGDRPVMVVR
jgi:hypothetical protein